MAETKWLTVVMSLFIGIITPLIIGMGLPCIIHNDIHHITCFCPDECFIKDKRLITKRHKFKRQKNIFGIPMSTKKAGGATFQIHLGNDSFLETTESVYGYLLYLHEWLILR